VIGAFALPSTALATFPGTSGKIAFTRDYDIYTVNADGTHLVNLTHTFSDTNGGGPMNQYPAWSADGAKIVFTRSRNRQFPDIFTMNADGSGVRRLTTGENDYLPSWSPDGRQITFEGQFAGPGIYVMNADGTGQHEIVQPTGELLNVQSPVWSPDGTRILFEGDNGSGCDLYTVNPDGTGQNQLTDGASSGACYARPDWSPDGSKIVFTNSLSGALWTMNADGSNPMPIQSGYSTYGESWSADGSRIVFGSTLAQGGFPSLYTVNADGSGITRLTLPAACNYFCGDTDPSWQPLPPQ
jgi:TolB protein